MVRRELDVSGKDWQKKLDAGEAGNASRVQGCGGVPPTHSPFNTLIQYISASDPGSAG